MNWDKVPSKIAYLKADHAQAQAQGRKIMRWGFEAKVSSSYDVCSWTKLLLDQTREIEENDVATSSSLHEQELLWTPVGRTAQDIVSDYLGELYLHCMEILSKNYEEALLKLTPIEFFFTVPAVWPPRARKATEQAAISAGFGSRSGDTIKVRNNHFQQPCISSVSDCYVCAIL